MSGNLLANKADLPVAQMVNLPAMQETRVRSLGWEVPLEKRMATHSSILAWRIPWTEKPGRLQSMRCKGLDMAGQLTHTYKGYIGRKAITNLENIIKSRDIT